LSLGAAAARASSTSPVNGVDYLTLPKALPVYESGKKVAVTEFFNYNSPQCNELDPALAGWVKAQGDNITFKRVNLAYRPQEETLQRLFYAVQEICRSKKSLEGMNARCEELHKKIFEAVHVLHLDLNDEAVMKQFLGGQGMDLKEFMSYFHSFGVTSQINQAYQMARAYNVTYVPLLAVDGLYEIPPALLCPAHGGHSGSECFADTLKVMDWLVAKAAKDRIAARQSVTAKPAAVKKSK